MEPGSPRGSPRGGTVRRHPHRLACFSFVGALLVVLLGVFNAWPRSAIGMEPQRPWRGPAPADVNITAPPGCWHLERVCFDQQQVVLTDPSYHPQSLKQRALPQFEPLFHYNFPHDAGSNSDIWAKEQLQLPPLLFRTASQQEPTHDLRHPKFNCSTVPLIFAPEWGENFGHTLGNSATWLHAHLHTTNASSWAARAALVVVTPLGLALPCHWQTSVGPLVPWARIQTLADFSARGRGQGGSPAGPSRCFAHALVCAGYKELEAANISQTAQALVQMNSPLPPSPVANQLAECSGSGNTDVCLRVLFLTRGTKPAIRQVLNLYDLLRECNGWRHTDPPTSTTYAATCAAYQPGSDLRSDMAAIRSADVVMGTHGAGMANAFFAKPGAAMMEIFLTGWTWQVHRIWLDQEAQPQLQWWALTVEDPAAYTAGELEQQLLPHPHLYKGPQGEDKRQRDQNLRVPWTGLSCLLQEYAGVQAAGGMAAYRARRAAQVEPVHYRYLEGGQLVPGGTSTMFGGSFGSEVEVERA